MKKKLPSVKSLERKLWILCKEIIRHKYPNVCYTCGKENLQGKDWHTGHAIKKRLLPFTMKHDLRLLRPQCARCNLRNNGNEFFFAMNMLQIEGPKYLNKIWVDYNVNTKCIDVYDTTQRKRNYFHNMIEQYKLINLGFEDTKFEWVDFYK